MFRESVLQIVFAIDALVVLKVFEMFDLVALAYCCRPNLIGFLKVFPLFLGGIFQFTIRPETCVAYDFVHHER